MNKFIKFCAIFAAVMIGVGIIIGLLVNIIGGRSVIRMVKEENISVFKGWNFHPFRIWDWDWDWNWPWDNWNYDYDYDYEWDENSGDWDYDSSIWHSEDLQVNGFTVSGNRNEETISDEGIRRLDINVAACEFTLKEWDEKNYKIEIEGWGSCDYYISDDTFYIESFKQAGLDWDDNEIILYVPAGAVYEEAVFDIGAGSAVINGIEADTIDGTVGMGKASFENVEAGDLMLDSGMGNTTFDGRADGDISVTCSMGKVELELANHEDEYDYSIDCAAGRIRVGNESYSTIAGSKEINNHADYNMDLECGMGKITVEFDN